MPRRPAIFTQADLTRAAKAASVVGYVVEIAGGVIRLVPFDEQTKSPDVEDEESSSWDAALA